MYGGKGNALGNDISTKNPLLSGTENYEILADYCFVEYHNIMVSCNTSKMNSSSHTVLYIEDDKANRQLVEFILQTRDDLRFIEAENGSEGIELAIQQKPDIILLDISLPDISGFDVLRQIRGNKETGQIPVIAISGDTSPDSVAIGLNAGFSGYLGKPISIEKLLSTIEKEIGAYDF